MTGRQQGAARRLHAQPARLALPKAREPTSVATGVRDLRQATRIRPDTGPTDRRRILAAVLSALVPGLGQAYNQRRRLALVLFVPFAVVAAIAVLAVWAIPGPRLDRQRDRPAQPRPPARPQPRPPRLAPGRPQPGVLRRSVRAPAGAPRASSAWPWSSWSRSCRTSARSIVGGVARSTFAEVFDGQTLGARSDGDTARIPGTNERLNVLLIGMDKGRGRDHALTDTLIVVSLDPVGKSVSMASLPRDLVNVPLGDGRTFGPKLNSLLSYATRHPKDFPAGGTRTLEDAVGALLGIPIHYYATVDLAGFAKMVDAVGGVDVNVRQPLERSGVRRLRDPEGRLVGHRRQAPLRRPERARLRPDPPVRGPDRLHPPDPPAGDPPRPALEGRQGRRALQPAEPARGGRQDDRDRPAARAAARPGGPRRRDPGQADRPGRRPLPARPSGQARREQVRRGPAPRLRPDPGGGRRAVPGTRDACQELEPEGLAAAEPSRKPSAQGIAVRLGPAGQLSAARWGAIRRAARARCEIRFFSAADHSPSVRPPGGSLAGSKIGS